MCTYSVCAFLPVTTLSARNRYAGFHLLGFVSKILKKYRGLFSEQLYYQQFKKCFQVRVLKQLEKLEKHFLKVNYRIYYKPRENKYIYNVEITQAGVFTHMCLWIRALIPIQALNQNKHVFNRSKLQQGNYIGKYTKIKLSSKCTLHKNKNSNQWHLD